MAEHDLWNEEDFFEKLKKEKKAAEKSESPEPEAEKEQDLPESPLDEESELLESDLFEKEEAKKEEKPVVEEDIFFNEQEEVVATEEPPELAQDFEEESQPVSPFEAEEESFEEQKEISQAETPEVEEEKGSAPKKYALSSNYEDEKLAPVNYKPVIIGAIVVVLIIALFFLLRGYIFMGKAEKEVQPTAQQKTEQETGATKTPEQNPLQVQQNQFFASLAGANAQSLETLSAIQNSVTQNHATLTSLLLYMDELTFEIHCKTRDDLAKAAMNLRNLSQLKNLKLISTTELPEGGLNAVFHAYLSNAAKAATVGVKLPDVNALKQWLTALSQQVSVNIAGFEEIETAPAQLELTRVRALFRAQGSFQGVMSFIQALAAANRNLKVHKVVLTALNHRNLKKSNYRVEVTLDLFK